MSSPENALLRMGAIGRPHGIRGELAVDWQGEHAPRTGDIFIVVMPDGIKTRFAVLSCRWHKGRLLLALSSISDRSQAERLTGAAVYMDRAFLPAPAPDEAYLADLPGCDVFLANGVFLGILDHLEFPAQQPVWAILDASGHEILFPARSCFIKALDMSRRQITIDPPEGLLDIYCA